jgi:DNA replication protein DnaC
MAEALSVRLEQARSGPLDHLEFLDLLVGDELDRRSDRLFAFRLKQAGIVQVKELSEFDFSFNPKIPRAKLVDLATARFVATHQGVLLLASRRSVLIGSPGIFGMRVGATTRHSRPLLVR